MAKKRSLSALLVILLTLTTAHAATITVTTIADNGAGSLRQAIADSNDGDTIQFDPALNGQTIVLTTNEIAIDRNIVINGPGSDLLAVSRLFGAKINFRLFHVMPGHTATIEGLRISNGVAGPAESDGGGGILNEGATLSITNCDIQHNENINSYGGGGVASTGQSAVLTIANSTVRDNVVFLGTGAGIYNRQGRLMIVQCTIRDNEATFTPLPGGGIYNDSGFMTISNSTITGNQAGDRGGGIENRGPATITDTVVSKNVAGEFGGNGVGGGISQGGGNLTILRCNITGNTATGGLGAGGGIYYVGGYPTSPVTITDSTISNNQADSFGGGIEQSFGTVIITGCTISGNHAGSASNNSGYGGGIHCSHQIAIIQNSTLSNNSCILDGGAIHDPGHLIISNSTISDNVAGRNANGIYNFGGGTVDIANSIFNTLVPGVNIWNADGTVTSHGYNLTSDNGGGYFTQIGDLIDTDPMLGPLQYNGGLTMTHQLVYGSPAVNAGNPSFTPPPFNDQRGIGYDRIVNGRVDIGSFELPPIMPTPTPTPIPSVTPVPSPAQLGNISTRMEVQTSNYISIAGFIITGAAPKTVAVRGIGPSLGAFGVPGLLTNPSLALRDSNGSLVIENDNWTDDPTQAAALATLGLAPQIEFESGIVTTLASNASYTATLAPENGGAGLGLVEVYDANSGAPSQLANISTRGLVQNGDGVMIGGFILYGSANTHVALRGIGPSLSQFGIPDALTDPTIELRDSNGVLLVANDNWQDDPISAAQLTAAGLAPTDPLESGTYISLQPSLYTAILAGKNGGVGVGLIEIYNLN